MSDEDRSNVNDAAPAKGTLYDRMAAIAAAQKHLGTRDELLRELESEAEALPPHDPETGEIIDASEADELVEEPRAPPPPVEEPPVIQVRAPEQPAPQPEAPRADTKPEPEVVPPKDERDPWAASSMGAMIDMLERGQFGADALGAMMALGQGMTELAGRTGKSQKGKVVITLDLKTEADAFFVEAAFKITAPKEPRPRTMAWQSDDGRFMPSMPRQRLLMGVPGTEHGPRVVGGNREIRTIS